jgi:subtilase family serine protease
MPPFQLQRAYDLKPLYDRGLTGRGRTIVIVDAFGSPTTKQDLQRFDNDFGLPDPPSFKIIQPAGKVPALDPTDADMALWAEETSLDVQWAHSIAPGANLLLVETPCPRPRASRASLRSSRPRTS